MILVAFLKLWEANALKETEIGFAGVRAGKTRARIFRAYKIVKHNPPQLSASKAGDDMSALKDRPNGTHQ